MDPIIEVVLLLVAAALTGAAVAYVPTLIKRRRERRQEEMDARARQHAEDLFLIMRKEMRRDEDAQPKKQTPGGAAQASAAEAYLAGEVGRPGDIAAIRHGEVIAVLRSILEANRAAVQTNRQVISLLTGAGGTSGYTEMTDEEAVIQEKAQRLQRQYGCSHEEAVKRARESAVYDMNGGMGDRV